jgi:uncharacterized membrane protein
MRAHQPAFQHALMPLSPEAGADQAQVLPLELAAVRFDGEGTAVSRYASAKAVGSATAWAEKVGFVERHRNGRLLLRGVFAGHYVYVDEGDRISQSGAAEAGIAGALLGALLGPPGLAVGLTIGAVVGSQSGTPTDLELEPEPLVARLREMLSPSSSAIVAIAGGSEIDELLELLGSDAEAVTRRSLTSQEQSALDASLGATPIAIPAGRGRTATRPA